MSLDSLSAIAVEHRHPISVDLYHHMIDSGVLTEHDRVELIEGVIVAVRRCRRSRSRWPISSVPVGDAEVVGR